MEIVGNTKMFQNYKVLKVAEFDKRYAIYSTPSYISVLPYKY